MPITTVISIPGVAFKWKVSALKRKEILTAATPWMNLVVIMLVNTTGQTL